MMKGKMKGKINMYIDAIQPRIGIHVPEDSAITSDHMVLSSITSNVTSLMGNFYVRSTACLYSTNLGVIGSVWMQITYCFSIFVYRYHTLINVYWNRFC